MMLHCNNFFRRRARMHRLYLQNYVSIFVLMIIIVSFGISHCMAIELAHHEQHQEESLSNDTNNNMARGEFDISTRNTQQHLVNDGSHVQLRGRKLYANKSNTNGAKLKQKHIQSKNNDDTNNKQRRMQPGRRGDPTPVDTNSDGAGNTNNESVSTAAGESTGYGDYAAFMNPKQATTTTSPGEGGGGSAVAPPGPAPATNNEASNPYSTNSYGYGGSSGSSGSAPTSTNTAGTGSNSYGTSGSSYGSGSTYGTSSYGTRSYGASSGTSTYGASSGTSTYGSGSTSSYGGGSSYSSAWGAGTSGSSSSPWGSSSTGTSGSKFFHGPSVKLSLLPTIFLSMLITFTGMLITAHRMEHHPEGNFANCCRVLLHTVNCIYKVIYNLYHCRLGDIPQVVFASELEEDEYTEEEIERMRLRPGIERALDVEHRKALRKVGIEMNKIKITTNTTNNNKKKGGVQSSGNIQR